MMELLKLTGKQENFCLAYMKLGVATDAYRAAYNSGKMKSNTIVSRSRDVMKNPKIKARLTELQAKVESKAILNAIQIQEMLTVRALEELDNTGLKALDMLNKMQGSYTEKIEQVITQEVNYYAPKKDDNL